MSFVYPAISPCPAIDARTRIMGLHRLLPMAYHGEDMAPLWAERLTRVDADADDAAALMDMSLMLQCLGRTDEALALMAEALRIQRDFCVVHGDGSGLRLLAFVTPGDLMANTPIDFLINGSNTVLWLRYVDAETRALDNLPEHDVAFMAIGEANGHAAVLARMAALLGDCPQPVMNADPAMIARLTRDGVSAMLADEPALLAPLTHRFPRAALAAVAAGEATFGADLAFPVIVRPIGTHAGHGMARIEGPAPLADYLAGAPATDFYVAPFIDYRGADGLFNKQRIVFIDGQPFASHMALSTHWMVHYVNADMIGDAGKRAIEADWMARFDSDFALRHAAAFAALHRRIGLDYFGIDCAEMPDGRLLVFELDVAMVVHDMDDPVVFPYKLPAMAKLFAAFVAAARRRATLALVPAA